MTPRQVFIGANPTFDQTGGHILFAGASGTGKTVATIGACLNKLHDPLSAVIIIDPDGDISPRIAEHAANPLNDLGWRRIHYLKPASLTECFALPLLNVPDGNVLDCHTQALRARAVFESSINFGDSSFGPRMTKLFDLGAFTLALNRRPLCDLPDLFARGAHELREALGAALPYPFLADEWASLDRLPERTFVEYRDPLASRLIQIFSNPRIRRVFGPQGPVDIAKVMRNREALLLDLAGLEHSEAVLVGKALFSLIYYAALQREPNREPDVFVAVDEVFDYLNPAMLRGFDRLRKRRVTVLVCIQRLAQVEKASDPEIGAALSAVISGTRTKVVFRLEDPDDADYMARVMFLGYVPLDEPKPGAERPVTVGHERQIVRNRSTTTHEATHEATAITDGIARGVSYSRTRAITDADGESNTDAVSDAVTSGSSIGESTMTGSMAFDGTSMSLSQDPFSGGIVSMPNYTNLAQGVSSGTGLSSGSSHSSATSKSASRGSSHAISRSHTTAVTEGESWGETEVTSHAVSRMHGTSRGTSESAGEGETFVPVLEWLPSFYSLEEQMHRLAGELKTLPLRECFLKIDNAPPVRVRTADFAPAFKSALFKHRMLPIFEKKLAQSPYLHPVAAVDALMAPVTNPTPAEPLHTPEPLPEPLAPRATRSHPLSKCTSQQRQTLRSQATTTATKPFEIIDGGKDGKVDGDKSP